MSTTKIFRPAQQLQHPLHEQALQPVHSQAIHSASLAVSISRAVDTVTSSAPIETTVKLILKKKIIDDTAKSHRYVTLQKLVGLAGNARHMANLEDLIAQGSEAHQDRVDRIVAAAFKVVSYTPNKPAETAEQLRKKIYSSFQHRV